MKFSPTTIEILKNFMSINHNIVLKPGNVLYTISPSKFIYAEANIAEMIPEEFGIYDLKELINILSIFSDPDIQFDPEFNSITISEGKMKVRFGSSELEVLVYPKRPNIFPESPEVSFTLSKSLYQQIKKSTSILKAPFVSIIGDGETIKINVSDKNNPNSNSMLIEVGETDHTFHVNLKSELFVMMEQDYTFEISGSRRACKVDGEDKFYLLAWEEDSSFTL